MTSNGLRAQKAAEQAEQSHEAKLVTWVGENGVRITTGFENQWMADRAATRAAAAGAVVVTR